MREAPSHNLNIKEKSTDILQTGGYLAKVGETVDGYWNIVIDTKETVKNELTGQFSERDFIIQKVYILKIDMQKKGYIIVFNYF